jgi:hypothetical protein
MTNTEMHVLATRSMVIISLLTALVTETLAEPLPQPKVGTCPAGYRDSGGYCAPISLRSPVAIRKHGPCPSNWVQSGDYCVQMRRH